MALNDKGKTVLFAIIIGGALTVVAIMRGHFDVAALLAAASYLIAAAVVATARNHRKQS